MQNVHTAIARLRAGGMIVLLDDEDRENEGDIILAAEFATTETVNFMARYGRGLICLAMAGSEIDRLGLSPMVARNQARRSTAFTVSIEARDGITTGISAADRAQTIRIATDPASGPGQIASPGHVFPLRAAPGGVLERNGHTEGAVDLMQIAGLRPSAVICEVMRDDGEMMRRTDMTDFVARHDLPVLTMAQLVDYRLREETLVQKVSEASLPTAHTRTPLRVHAFRSMIDSSEDLALTSVGTPAGVPLVRLHSECLTGDAFGSLRCDCGAQLQESLRRIDAAPGNILLYLRGQEGRGIGLANKICAYHLQDQGLDTVEANRALGLPDDSRNYAKAAQILRAMGHTEVRLLSNNPAKAAGLEHYGVRVVATEPLIIPSNPFNARYLETKAVRFGHSLPLPETVLA